jgi:large subunit ribosomal protein L4
MKLPVFTQAGDRSETTLQVSEELFACAFNEDLVHQVVTAYMAAGRAGTKAQKTRSEVRGGGIKPWKQKGTGRARAGSIRSPLWRGGGRAFAATPRSFQQKVNRKMYRQALRSIFSELVRQDRLKVLDKFIVKTPKTKDLVQQLQGLKVKKALIITDREGEDQNLWLAAGNIPHVLVSELGYMDPVSLVAYEHVIVTVDVLKKIEETLL